MVGYELAQCRDRWRPVGRELSLLGLLWVAAFPAWAQPAQPKQIEESPAPVKVHANPVAAESVVMAASPVESMPNLHAVPADARVTRHYVDAKKGEVQSFEATDSAAGDVADLVGQVIYSNRPEPGMLLAPGAGIRIADDVTTVALEDCSLSGVELRFSGGGDGTGEGFDVEFAIYNGCPSDGGQIIAGSERSLSFDHDGVHIVLIDLLETPITIPRDIWIANTFSRDGAGWVMGEPASIGFTENLYEHESGNCTSRFPGTNQYAGFHVRLHAIGEFEQEHVAYLNNDIDGFGTLPLGVDDLWLSDPVTIETSQCVITSYEVAGISDDGPYAVQAQLWRECDPSTVIEGTQGTATGVGDGAPDLFKFTLPEGVAHFNRDFWISWKYDSPQASAIVAGEAEFGFTEDWFGLWGIPNSGDCGIFFFEGDPYAGFRIVVNCAGDSSLGACCDVEPVGNGTGDATCHLTEEIECQREFNRWREGQGCPGRCFATDIPCASDDDCRTCSLTGEACLTDEDCLDGETCENDEVCGTEGVFNPPCGHHACCVPPNYPSDEGCVELSRAHCEFIVDADGNPANWMINEFCDPYEGGTCVPWACHLAENNCAFPNTDAGCSNDTCCESVCANDPWCCDVSWDLPCRLAACETCENICEEACITQTDPPGFLIDARQPHLPYHKSTVQTPISVVVEGLPVPCESCWEVCDTLSGPGDVNLDWIEPLGGTKYRLYFDRRAPWPASTILDYKEQDNACGHFAASVTIIPGDVNADQTVDLADVADYASFLAGEGPELAYPYSCDIDRSDACNPADLLRLIDLLNGAGDYEPMLGVTHQNDQSDCDF